jgi:hypothetical protein
MSFLNLFHPGYYFATNQTSTFFGFWPLVGVLVLLLVSGYVIGAKSKKMPSPMRQVAQILSGTAILIGWLALLWMFFRYQTAPYLSWRFWPLLMLIYAVWQIVLAIKFVKKDYPKKLALKENVGEKEEWLKRYKKRK